MATSLARPIANRAVHLRITPRPSNLGESREIMRLISQFGEVEYFKNLKYDTLSAPNAALVIFREENAARDCLRRSPIRFRMGRVSPKDHQPEADETTETTPCAPTSSNPEQKQPRGPTGGAFGIAFPTTQARPLSTSSLPTPPPNPIRMPFEPAPPPRTSSPQEDDSRIFQIITNPCNRHFRDHVNIGHYHGGFAIDTKMPGQEDLAGKVPLLGLSCVDWKAVDRPWRVVAAEKKKWAGSGSLSKLARDSKRAVEPDATVEDANHVADASEENFAAGGLRHKGNEHDSIRLDSGERSRTGSNNRFSEDDTLDTIMKGWESVFPGGSSESTNMKRYSGKPK